MLRLSNQPLIALHLYNLIIEATKDDISVFAYSIREWEGPAKDIIMMIAEQADDNLPAMQTMFGEGLIQRILKFRNDEK